MVNSLSQEQTAQLRKAEAVKRELQRKSLDTILVHNITYEDYILKWDSYNWVVPNSNKDIGFGRGNMQLPRYLAKKYIRELTDKVLTENADKAVSEENERRISKGMAAMTNHQEQFVFEYGYRISKPELREPVIRKLWLGVVKEYGLDDVPRDEPKQVSKSRPVDEDILDKLEGLYADSDNQSNNVTSDTAGVREEKIKGVSK